MSTSRRSLRRRTAAACAARRTKLLALLTAASIYGRNADRVADAVEASAGDPSMFMVEPGVVELEWETPKPMRARMSRNSLEVVSPAGILTGSLDPDAFEQMLGVPHLLAA